MHLTAEQIESCERYDAFVARIAAELKAIADSRGFSCDGENERACSRYVTIRTLDPDGCRDELVASARISDHVQRYSGPDWSFEDTDSEESIARGLATIRKLVAEF